MQNNTTTTNPVSALSSCQTFSVIHDQDLSDMAVVNAIANTFMSSLDIAELTGKQHKHVMRDITRMLEDLEIGRSKFAQSYFNSQNKEQPCFHLPLDLVLTLVSGYDVNLRKRIVSRWFSLEQERFQALQKELAETQGQLSHANFALGQTREYATIKRMTLNYHGQKFKWPLLKKASEELGIDPIDVYDLNYGTVKAYHMDAWQKAYALEIPYVSPDHDIDQDGEGTIQDEL